MFFGEYRMKNLRILQNSYIKDFKKDIYFSTFLKCSNFYKKTEIF